MNPELAARLKRLIDGLAALINSGAAAERTKEKPMATAVGATPRGYRIEVRAPKDSQAKRNRAIRWFWLGLFVLAAICEPIVFFRLWGSFTHSGTLTKVMTLAGVVAMAPVLIAVLRRMLVYNPEWTGYVTQNWYGNNVPYGPGLHPSLPWEERNQSGNYSLKVITRPFTVSVPTSTSAVKVNGMFQYQIDLSRITDFIGIDATTVETGLIGFIQSFLTSRFAGITGEKARASLVETNQALGNEFMDATHDGLSAKDFEQKYGILTATVLIETIEFPPEVQKARNAIDEATAINTVVAKLMGMSPRAVAKGLKDGTIHRQDYREYLNRAMATSGNANMTINAQEINLPGMFDKLVDAIANIGNNLTGGGGTSKPSRKPKPKPSPATVT